MRSTLAFIGGGEFGPATRELDAALLERSGGTDVVVVPTAAAYERPEHVVAAATEHFRALGATVTALAVTTRHDLSDSTVAPLAAASFVYIADGSPLHLRSVMKDSLLYAALLRALDNGAVIAASGAGATLLADPMVDPRGGAYTVGLGIVSNLAVFAYHGPSTAHLWERSKVLLPAAATLVGVEQHAALVRDPDGAWHVGGTGRATVYRRGQAESVVESPNALILD